MWVYIFIMLSSTIAAHIAYNVNFVVGTRIKAKSINAFFVGIAVIIPCFFAAVRDSSIVLDSIIKMYTHISLTPIPYDSSKMLSSVSIYRFANISKEYSLQKRAFNSFFAISLSLSCIRLKYNKCSIASGIEV